MDSVSHKSMITIEAKNFRLEDEISTPPEKFELILRVVAAITLTWHGHAVYSERSFPAVELAFF